jgi:hypothetical protein
MVRLDISIMKTVSQTVYLIHVAPLLLTQHLEHEIQMQLVRKYAI